MLVGCLSTVVNAQNFRASASAGVTSGNSTLTINLPAGTIGGDVMIAAVTVRPYNVSITAPVGWTRIRLTTQTSGNTSEQATYWKAAGASEPASYSWTFSTSPAAGAAGGISTFYNINNSNPINVESGHATASSTTHATPSVTTTVANTMVVTTHSIASSDSWTPPAGMTECVDISSNAVGYTAGVSVEMNYVTQPLAGATGTKTATASNSDYGVAQIVALNSSATISYAGSPYCSTGGTHQ